MAKRKLSDAERQKKIVELLKQRDRARKCYQSADKLIVELRDGGMKPGDKVKLPGDRTATLKDNFADVDKVFKTAAVQRYEIDVAYD